MRLSQDRGWSGATGIVSSASVAVAAIVISQIQWALALHQDRVDCHYLVVAISAAHP
jgi:hypothetical protein